MSMDIKLREGQMSKIIQSSGFLGFWLGEVGKKVVTDLAISLAKNNFPALVK